MPMEFKNVVGDDKLIKLGIHFSEYKRDYESISKALIDHLNYGEEGEFLMTLRSISLEDMFFFAYFVLDYPVNHPFLIQRIYDSQENPHYTMDMWAREHWKSTIRTCIQPIWEVIRNPEERVGIFSHTKNMAKSHLRKIKIILEENKLLKSVFPDVFYVKPDRQAPKWSENDGLYVKRKGNYGEGTFEAAGLIDGMPTGKHYSIRIFDDIVNDQTVSNVEASEKALDKFYHSEYLKTDGGIKRIVGTRYDSVDPYAKILKKNKRWKYLCFPSEVDHEGKGIFNGTPVFFSREELDERRAATTDYQYACQMLQDPTQEMSAVFKTETIRFYEPDELPSGLHYYVICDPASKKIKKSDYTVFFVVGTDEKRQFWVTDIVRDKLSLSEKWRVLSDLQQKWQPFEVGYEQYGMQSDIEYIEERQEAERRYFKITPLSGNVAKTDRIMKLSGLFDNKRILFPKIMIYHSVDGGISDMVSDFIHLEFEQFPKPTHDDMLDCLARILDRDMRITFPEKTVLGERKKEGGFNPFSGSKSQAPSMMAAWF